MLNLRSYRPLGALLLLTPLVACDQRVSELETLESRAGYAIGMDVGQFILQSGVELDMAAFMQGLEDAMEDRELLLSAEDAGTALTEFQVRSQEMQMARDDETANRNLADGEAFLAENAQKEGWVTTESGLQYRIIEQGDGPLPVPSSLVQVHYRGTFIDGEVFDDSYERGEPANFRVDGVIAGWTEALQLMPVGTKFEVAIHPDLAYGRQAPPQIGPNRVLHFEVEVLDILN